MSDPFSDLLLAAVALAMLILAVEIHGLPKKLSTQWHAPTSTPTSVPTSVPTSTLESKPKVSEADATLDYLDPEGRKTLVVTTEVPKEAEKPKEEKPFSMEKFVNET